MGGGREEGRLQVGNSFDAVISPSDLSLGCHPKEHTVPGFLVSAVV